jgi:hypothetical protein
MAGSSAFTIVVTQALKLSPYIQARRFLTPFGMTGKWVLRYMRLLVFRFLLAQDIRMRSMYANALLSGG